MLHTRQAKAAKALDDLSRMLKRQSLPPDETKAIRSVVNTFADDRNMLVVVDEDGMVEGLFVQLGHIFGAAIQTMRRYIKGRRPGASARWVFGLLPKWDVLPATLELAKAASDYREWAAKTRVDLDQWPPERTEGVTHTYPLVSVVKFLQEELPIKGRFWEDVADEVTEPVFHDNDEPEESAAD